MSQPWERWGEYYWCVETPDRTVLFHAERVDVQDGVLIAYTPEDKPHLLFKDWTVCHAASVITGDACSVEHWNERTEAR